MYIVVVGLNHRTAPVELRERVSILDQDLSGVLDTLKNTRSLLESVVLSTCNRTEVYVVASSVRAAEDFLSLQLARRTNLSASELREHLYIYQGQHAVRHLMRVASGLDSLVVGETQILGQVKSAHALAMSHKNCGALLNKLFRMAIQLGKRAQTETRIGQNGVSVSYAAVQLAKKILGRLEGRRVLVIGAGKMSTLAVQYLAAQGVQDLVIVNRTFEKAQKLASEWNGTARAWDTLKAELKWADIVITSTGSSQMVLDEKMVREAIRERGGKPVVLLDIAVPRDIDPKVGSMRNVYLFDIDDLEGVVVANREQREREASVVQDMIESTLRDFSDWLSEQDVVPVIAAVRAKAGRIQSEVLDSLKLKMPHLSDHDVQLLQKHTMSIVNQILRDPVENMKEMAIAAKGSADVQSFADLFGVSEEEVDAFRHQSLVADDTRPATDLRGFIRHFTGVLLDDYSEPDARQGFHPVLR